MNKEFFKKLAKDCQETLLTSSFNRYAPVPKSPIKKQVDDHSINE